MKWLEGKKTYIAAVLGIAAALVGAYFGVLSNDAAAEIVVGALVAMGFRSAFNTMIARALVDRATEEGAKRRPAAALQKEPPPK